MAPDKQDGIDILHNATTPTDPSTPSVLDEEFDASRGLSTNDYPPCSGPRLLALNVVFMDEVATVGQCYSELSSDDEPLGDGRLDSSTRLWLFELQRLAQSSVSGGTEHQSARIARVAMTGHTTSQTTSLSGISPETALGDFESLIPLIPGIMDGSLRHGTEHLYLPLSSAIRSYCRNRRAFVTSKGWLGIGPLDTKDGDAAAVVVGAQVPFLLRMAPERRWRLVGEAYVEGLMNGESFGDRPAVEVIELC